MWIGTGTSFTRTVYGGRPMNNRKILLDTKILIYAWDKSDIVKHKKAIDLFLSFRHQLYLSAQNLSEFSAVMIKHKCDLEWLSETIRHLGKAIPVLPVKDSDVLDAVRAVNRYKLSYWDAQIWAVARSNNIPSIFTEDGPVGRTIEGVTYINPLA